MAAKNRMRRLFALNVSLYTKMCDVGQPGNVINGPGLLVIPYVYMKSSRLRKGHLVDHPCCT